MTRHRFKSLLRLWISPAPVNAGADTLRKYGDGGNPGAVTAFEPPEQNVMRRPPRDAREPILSHYLIWQIVFVSFIIMGGTIGAFLWEMKQGVNIEHALSR